MKAGTDPLRRVDLVRVAEPSDLENLLARIRAGANVSTRTTIVLSTPYESRPPKF